MADNLFHLWKEIMAPKLLLVLIVIAAVTAGGLYVALQGHREVPKPTGDVYDYHKDPELVKAVQMALSLQATMTRLTAGRESQTGPPEVRYAIDSVSLVAGGEIEVRYRLVVQYPTRTEQKEYVKRFRRKADGTWAAAR